MKTRAQINLMGSSNVQPIIEILKDALRLADSAGYEYVSLPLVEVEDIIERLEDL